VSEIVNARELALVLLLPLWFRHHEVVKETALLRYANEIRLVDL
jgi:hypothetical protein